MKENEKELKKIETKKNREEVSPKRRDRGRIGGFQVDQNDKEWKNERK